MESTHSASGETQQATLKTPGPQNQDLSDHWFNESFENLLPKIQERWPDLAKQTLEASRGSLDEVIRIIAEHSGKTTNGVRDQLEEIFASASHKTKDIADSLEPLEKQLEEILDELNQTLRPRIEKPIRQRPLLAIGMAAGFGLLIGLLMSGGRKS